VVNGKTHAVRVGYAREYLVWGLERALYRLDVSDLRVWEIRERCERIRRAAIDFQRPSSDGAAKRIGLDHEKRARLLEVINPTYPQNPFRRTVRFRNWVMVVLLMTFGFRRGESLKIYVTDVNVKGRTPSLTIHRRPGDVLDTRANEPAVKTLGRKVPLSPEMAQMLDAFIMHHRPRFPGADRSPFLFFSEDGNPLALRSVNAMLERIVACFPEFEGLLSPHVLRYTYNDMLTESATAAGVDAETLKQTRNYLNGWSLTSEQGALYSRRAVEERAAEISVAHQRGLFA
jgi:integrase